MHDPNRTQRNANFSLTLRDAMILLLAVLAGLAAGILMCMDEAPLAHSALGAAGALALSVKFFDTIIRK
jgi:hypothetical protein